MAENRLIGTIKIISSSFNDAALLYDMLADVSMPRSQNGAPWRPWYDGGGGKRGGGDGDGGGGKRKSDY